MISEKTSRTHARSLYMEFSKLRSRARHNLASSGMASLPIAELHVDISRLEINGPDSYGYPPLKQAIARRDRVPEECVGSAAGTSMPNYLAMAACVEPGGGCAVEGAAYPVWPSTAR